MYDNCFDLLDPLRNTGENNVRLQAVRVNLQEQAYICI
jgi:hypothetical protein